MAGRALPLLPQLLYELISGNSRSDWPSFLGDSKEHISWDCFGLRREWPFTGLAGCG